MEWANNRYIIMGLILNSVLGANCVKRTYWHLVQLQILIEQLFYMILVCKNFYSYLHLCCSHPENSQASGYLLLYKR